MSQSTLPVEVLDLVMQTDDPQLASHAVAIVIESSDEEASDSDAWATYRENKAGSRFNVQIDGDHRKELHVRDTDDFAHIRKLDLSSNMIVSLTGHLSSLCRLTTLDLSSNMLGLNPSALDGIMAFSNLKSINLSANRLKEVPKGVLNLKSLREVRLGSNELTKLPEAICGLTKLEILYLGGNELLELPLEIGRLVNLRVLYLGDNGLTWLPSQIIDLQSLRTLDVHANRLEELPEEIMDMECLEYLSVRDNPLIMRFAQDAKQIIPTLLELAAGCIVREPRVLRGRCVSCLGLPDHLVDLLKSGRRCDNPECCGVFFQDYSPSNIQLNDFCGKYRLPFAKWVCSQSCTDRTSPIGVDKCAVKRVLMG